MRTYIRIHGSRADEITGEVVREQPLTIYVNSEKFLTLLCSPLDLEALVVGYPWMEMSIGGLVEIRHLEVSPVDGRAVVSLTHPATPPTERSRTAGRGCTS